MFFAINSKTKEKVNSLTLEKNPSYNFIKEDIWYADSDEIENCPQEIDITKIKVRFRVGGKGVVNWNGTTYDVSPHFFIPNKSKLGINTIPESKEHKLAKNWIYNKIKQKKLILRYSKINKPYKYHNEVNLFDLPIDYEKIGIEVTSSLGGKRRRADVICPFIVKHPLLGNGIVFEIQFTKQRIKTKISRELDWSIRGYSIAWLYKDDFNEISELIIDLKEDYVNVDSFANLIKQNNKSIGRDLKITVQEQIRKVDNYMEELFHKFKTPEYIDVIINNKIKNAIVDIRQYFQPICPRCKIRMVLRNNQKNGDKFWGCINYPECKSTSIWEENG